MAQHQVKPVQIVFDEEDIYIENLETDIKNLQRKIEAIEKKCLKNENLRLICFYNSLKTLLDEKQRKLDAAA